MNNAAIIIRRHFQSIHCYSVSTLQFINAEYGSTLMLRVMKMIHRINRRQGLVAQCHPAYTTWCRPVGSSA